MGVFDIYGNPNCSPVSASPNCCCIRRLTRVYEKRWFYHPYNSFFGSWHSYTFIYLDSKIDHSIDSQIFVDCINNGIIYGDFLSHPFRFYVHWDACIWKEIIRNGYIVCKIIYLDSKIDDLIIYRIIFSESMSRETRVYEEGRMKEPAMCCRVCCSVLQCVL